MKTSHATYALITTFCAVTAALVVFLICPILKDIRGVSDEILSARDNAVFAAQQSKALDDFEAKYQEYSPNLEKLEGFFVDSKDPIEFIKFLEKVAFDTGIHVDIRLAPSAKEIHTGMPLVIVFQISVQGDFLAVAAFVQKIETGQYLVNLYNLTIKKSGTVDLATQTRYDGVEANLLVEALAK